MLILSATDARKEWSETIDRAVRQKPQFIKRTRDHLVLAEVSFLSDLLKDYRFTASVYHEDDESVTLSLHEMDIIENAPTLEEAKAQLASAIYDYAEEYYNDIQYWHTASNRRNHLPYVMKALLFNDVRKIGEWITCQDGRN